MKKYNFDSIIDRKNTNCLKWDYLAKFLGKEEAAAALPLWIADMDFSCSDEIVEAMHKVADQRIYGYSWHGDDEYFDAVIGWFKKHFDWEIEKDSVFYSPGIVPAVALMVRMLTNEGDGVLIQRPVYYPFTNKIIYNDRVVVNNPLTYDAANLRYVMDYDDLDKKLSLPSTKGMILCSPHNPVGRVWSAEELTKVVEICEKYNKWIISDEIHCDIVREGVPHYPLEKVCPRYKHNIITCTAPSKSFNLAGLHISNIIINDPEHRKAWGKELTDRFSINLANPFAIAAMKAAYLGSEDWLRQVNAYIDENIEFVRQFVKEKLPRVKMIFPEGTYLVWLDLTDYSTDKNVLEKLMLEKAKVALDEGYVFGEEGAGFERINVACPRSILEDCMNRIAAALEHAKF